MAETVFVHRRSVILPGKNKPPYLIMKGLIGISLRKWNKWHLEVQEGTEKHMPHHSPFMSFTYPPAGLADKVRGRLVQSDIRPADSRPIAFPMPRCGSLRSEDDVTVGTCFSFCFLPTHQLLVWAPSGLGQRESEGSSLVDPVVIWHWCLWVWRESQDDCHMR